MAYVYPQTVYDIPDNLLAILGSFWAETYSGRAGVRDLLDAKCQLENQTLLDVLDLLAGLSRHTVPVHRVRNWFPLVLRESERNAITTSLPRYDTGLTYDTGLRYDVPFRSTGHAFPKPVALADARLAMNRFASPSLLWMAGVDFVLDADAVVFAANPFTDSRVAVRDIYIDGQVVDREATLWLFRGEFDAATIHRQFGYVLRMQLPSSLRYRELLNAVFDALVGGTTRQQVLRAFAAVTGIPLVLDAEERVEDIWLDSRGRLVITDKNVYRFTRDAVVTVAVGDIVKAGDTLTDGLRFFEFGHGEPPVDLAALALGRDFLATCFYSELVFENKEFPLTVVTDDPSGFTRLAWPLGGFAADVSHFFDELHTRGVTEALRPIGTCEHCETVTYPANDCGEETRQVRRGTLAHLLDRRRVRVGEPTAANLPATINPLRFLVKNILRNHACLVRINVANLGPSGLGLQHIRFIQQMVPPHTAMLVLFDISPQADTVAADLLTETIATFTAATPITDTVPVDLVRSGRVRAYSMPGTCH